VRNVDASFPTAIILAISSEDATYDPKTKTMSVRDANNVAKIIDGQHRIDGLSGYEGPTFQLNVTIFVDMDMEDQAIVFSTINLKQTPVGKSLVYDLYDFAETRSPQKTAHNIARLLNARHESPFYHKIMILGKATGDEKETITQAAFVKPLLDYISKEPMEDRDRLKRGLPLELARPDEERAMKLIFRNLFIREQDAEIAKIIWNYFGAVQDRWPDAWNVRQAGLILNRTTGFNALMKFLWIAYLTSADPGEVVSRESLALIFGRIRLSDADFTPERYKPGSSGQADLYRDLMRQTGLDESAVWRKASGGGSSAPTKNA
jgi:DGQHR domain-containing protein